jgi:hypothetical protein
MMAEGKIIDVAVKKTSYSIHLPKQSHQKKNINKYKKMYVILFITHHRYHSLTHIKTTAIEIQGIKIIKKNETRRKEHAV